MEPEQKLFQSVVFTAVIDANRNIRPKTPASEAVEIRRAKSWLSGNGKDFQFICALAGLEPSFISEKYRAGNLSISDIKEI